MKAGTDPDRLEPVFCGFSGNYMAYLTHFLVELSPDSREIYLLCDQYGQRDSAVISLPEAAYEP